MHCMHYQEFLLNTASKKETALRELTLSAVNNCIAINKEKSFRVLLDVIELRKGEDSYGD